MSKPDPAKTLRVFVTVQVDVEAMKYVCARTHTNCAYVSSTGNRRLVSSLFLYQQ